MWTRPPFARHGRQGSVLVDLFVVAVVVSIVGGLIAYGVQVAAPFHRTVAIRTSWEALPRYAFFSLCRGFAAYALSLGFTLVYGTIAARSARAERLMLPALDVLQAIPVLGFLPGLVLGMIALFPSRELGLELACVVMIFTGQAWNMAFSFYASVKGIPRPLREATEVYGVARGRVFRILELPASMIGLVWNSMMSMAGGWFFLTVNEAFTLGDKDFRLPGIGSFMAQAVDEGNIPAMLAAIATMSLVITLVDQVLWRPIVVWAEKFKLEESADANRPRSWFLEILRRSRLVRSLAIWRARRPARLRIGRPPVTRGARLRYVTTAVRWLLIIAALALVGWGAVALAKLLAGVPLRDPAHGHDWLHVVLAVGATFVRTTAAVAISGVWALPVGLMIGLSPRWSHRLQPVVQVVASFPAPMLFPVVVLLVDAAGVPFGVGAVVLMLLGAQWYVLFNVIAGAMAIPTDLVEVEKVYGTSRWRTWTRLYVPCVFPHLVTGLVTAAGGAWNASIVSEFVRVRGTAHAAFGLGSLINNATTAGNYPLLAASVLAMAVTVVLVNRLCWRRLFHLAQRRYALET